MRRYLHLTTHLFAPIMALFLVASACQAPEGMRGRAQQAASTQQPFRLLSMNLWQFPRLLPLSKFHAERADGLAAYIRAHHEEYDVLAFQELWSIDIRRRIYDQIKDLYPFKNEDTQPGVLWFGLDSGLAMYSKFPILRSTQRTFSNFRGPEHFAKKGVMVAEVQVNNHLVYVATSHLQAGAGPQEFFDQVDAEKPDTRAIATTQLKEIKSTIDGFVRDRSLPVFLIGDFNVAADSDEYRDMLRTLGEPIDTIDINHSEAGSSIQNIGEPEQIIGSRIDYIFTMNNHMPGTSRIFQLERIVVADHGREIPFQISDHLPVAGVFDLSQAPEGIPALPSSPEVIPHQPEPTACGPHMPALHTVLGVVNGTLGKEALSTTLPGSNLVLFEKEIHVAENKRIIKLGSPRQPAMVQNVRWLPASISGLERCNGSYDVSFGIREPFQFMLPYTLEDPADPTAEPEQGWLTLNVPLPVEGLVGTISLATSATRANTMTIEIDTPRLNALDVLRSPGFSVLNNVTVDGPAADYFANLKPMLESINVDEKIKEVLFPLIEDNLGPNGLGALEISATIDRDIGTIDVNAKLPFGLEEISTTLLF